MLMRKKLWVALGIVAFLMLASHTIQRRHFLSLSSNTPVSRDTPPRKDSGTEMAIESTMSTNGQNPKLTRGDVTDSVSLTTPKHEVEVVEVLPEKKQNENRPCGCSESCISDLSESEWFSQRYDPKQQPVLRDTNNNFDAESLKWWLALQRSGNDQTLEGVMAEMFRVVSPPTVDFNPLPSRCRTCAVVGNSGNLRQSGHGKLIDSHDSVIRMNKAVTRGYDKDVGNRTTHHFMYPESAVDIGQGVSLVLLPFKLRDLEWLTSALSTGTIKMTYMRVKERVAADKDKVLVVNPVFFKYVSDRWTEHHGRYPSTGMLAIIFALHTCDQVSVFGYGADKQGNWHHYWEENRYAGAFRKTGVHNADFETEVIHELSKQGKIKLYL